jgi:hypothetical protein
MLRLPWRGVGVEAEDMGVALAKEGVLVRKRRVEALGMLGTREARRQVRQIILDILALFKRLEVVGCCNAKLSKDHRRRTSAFRHGR